MKIAGIPEGSNEVPLGIILEAVKAAGYAIGKDVGLSLDPAISELFNKEKGKYVLEKEGGRELNSSLK